MNLRPGEVVGRYTLVEPLGEGAQGKVWKIVDPQNAAVRALKLLDLPRLPPSAPARAGIEVDAVMRAAEHPAIVRCHDVLALPGGGLGLVFELVRGQVLDELLGDARMTEDHRRAILDQLASALAHVHGCGVAHRDLKPENVLVTDGFWRDPHGAGNVKLVDFGIASILNSGTELTAAGGFVGTVAYLAPEVLSPGRWPRARTGCARDVFAFGVLAWELIVGGHPTGLPFDESPRAFAAVYEAARAGHAAWPPPGPVEPLAGVIAACLSIDPAARPADGAAIDRALARARAEQRGRRRAGPTKRHEAPTDVGGVVPQSGPASSPGPATVAPPSAPRRKRTAFPWRAVLATGALGIAAATGYVTVSTRTEAPALRPPISTAGTAPQGGASLPVPPSPPTATPPPCCPEGGSCKSGWTCAPGPCAPRRVPERWLKLRLTGAASGSFPAFPRDLAEAHPHAHVRLRRSLSTDDWIDVPVTKMLASNDGDREDRLRLLTSDLEEGRVAIQIVEGDTTLAQGTSAPNRGGLTTTTLCIGVRLYVGPRESSTHYIHGYLDDD